MKDGHADAIYDEIADFSVSVVAQVFEEPPELGLGVVCPVITEFIQF